MIFEQNYKVRIEDVGRDHKITNKALLGLLEDTACLHADYAGYGVMNVEKTGLVWLLLDWKLQVIKRPQYLEKINVKTWSRYTNKCYSYRDFEVYNENNEKVAIATSKWVLVDVNKGRIIKVEDDLLAKYEPETGKSVFNILELDKIKEPEAYEKNQYYMPRRSDIDMNNHMHNLAYLELAYEMLPEEVYQKNQFNNIRIHYKKEVKYGEKLLCKYIMQDGKNIITIKDEEDKNLHSYIEIY